MPGNLSLGLTFATPSPADRNGLNSSKQTETTDNKEISRGADPQRNVLGVYRALKTMVRCIGGI
jgi:hypothetical protein